MGEAEAKAPEAGRLVQYDAESGVALLTLNDPPANTYTYEMMQELERAILTARMDESVQVIVITRKGREVFLRRGEHSNARQRDPNFQILFLPPCQRDSFPSGTNSQARDRGD